MRHAFIGLLIVGLFAQACARQEKPPLTEAEIHAVAAVVMASVLDFEQQTKQRLDNLDERVKALETKPDHPPTPQPPAGTDQPEVGRVSDQPPDAAVRPENPEPSNAPAGEQQEGVRRPNGQSFSTGGEQASGLLRASQDSEPPAGIGGNQLRVVVGSYGTVDVDREPQVGDAFELPAGRFVVISTEPLQFRLESARVESSIMRRPSDSIVRFNSRGYVQPAYGRYDYPPPDIWTHLAGAHGQSDAYSLSRRDAELRHDAIHEGE